MIKSSGLALAAGLLLATTACSKKTETNTTVVSDNTVDANLDNGALGADAASNAGDNLAVAPAGNAGDAAANATAPADANGAGNAH